MQACIAVGQCTLTFACLTAMTMQCSMVVKRLALLLVYKMQSPHTGMHILTSVLYALECSGSKVIAASWP